jgi:hypothetical protein
VELADDAHRIRAEHQREPQSHGVNRRVGDTAELVHVALAELEVLEPLGAGEPATGF